MKTQKWTETIKLPSEAGTYKLTADVVLDETWKVDKEIILDLNGYGIRVLKIRLTKMQMRQSGQNLQAVIFLQFLRLWSNKKRPENEGKYMDFKIVVVDEGLWRFLRNL